jgi:hypothetical protein
MKLDLLILASSIFGYIVGFYGMFYIPAIFDPDKIIFIIVGSVTLLILCPALSIRAVLNIHDQIGRVRK